MNDFGMITKSGLLAKMFCHVKFPGLLSILILFPIDYRTNVFIGYLTVFQSYCRRLLSARIRKCELVNHGSH